MKTHGFVPERQRLALLDHKPLRLGILNYILRAVALAKHVSREDILASLGEKEITASP